MGRGGGAHGAATLIAGPTASGKTALALALAAKSGAAIVNADSMQVYQVLDRLTARPSPAETALAPHHLFGHVPPAEVYSTGRWLREVEALLTGPLRERPVILVGGTGLYFRALEGGLSEMPPVPNPIRDHWRGRMISDGPEVLHAELVQRDPEAARHIRPTDGQRIVRAIEVYEATGTPLSQHQRKRGRVFVDPETTRRIVLTPERDWLRDRIARRFHAMIESGAVDEVRRLRALALDPSVPAMKAIGVRQIGAMIDGEATLDEAVRRSIDATRQYAKRQATWFRNQFGADWQRRNGPEETEIR